MSETPRTDALAQFCYGHIDQQWVSAYEFQRLERELAAANARIAALEGKEAPMPGKSCAVCVFYAVNGTCNAGYSNMSAQWCKFYKKG